MLYRDEDERGMLLGCIGAVVFFGMFALLDPVSFVRDFLLLPGTILTALISLYFLIHRYLKMKRLVCPTCGLRVPEDDPYCPGCVGAPESDSGDEPETEPWS